MSNYSILRLYALGLFSAALLWTFLAHAGSPAPPVKRQAALLYLLKQDCGACHGLRLTGGLGLPLTPHALAGKDDKMLTTIILEGVPGTPMPPWKGEISPTEAAWLVRRLKRGATDAP